MRSLAEAIAFSSLVTVTGFLEFNGANVDGIWVLIVVWVLLTDWGKKDD